MRAVALSLSLMKRLSETKSEVVVFEIIFIMEGSVFPNYLNSILILQSLSHSICTFKEMVYNHLI